MVERRRYNWMSECRGNNEMFKCRRNMRKKEKLLSDHLSLGETEAKAKTVADF